MFEQLSLFAAVAVAVDDIDAEVQAILARRRAHNVSGQGGEDIHLIRAAVAASRWREASDA